MLNGCHCCSILSYTGEVFMMASGVSDIYVYIIREEMMAPASEGYFKVDDIAITFCVI